MGDTNNINAIVCSAERVNKNTLIIYWINSIHSIRKIVVKYNLTSLMLEQIIFILGNK